MLAILFHRRVVPAHGSLRRRLNWCRTTRHDERQGGDDWDHSPFPADAGPDDHSFSPTVGWVAIASSGCCDALGAIAVSTMVSERANGFPE